MQVEAQFATRRITSQRSKFDYVHVVTSLAPAMAGEVRDLLLKPPADHPYYDTPSIGVGSRGARGAVAPLDFGLTESLESRSGVK